MSAHIADSQLSFRLPSLSYIDAKWEEPNLRTPDAVPQSVSNIGLAAWLSRRVAAVAAWYRNSGEAAQLAAMSDYQLADIGLTRSDLARVFSPDRNQDLRERGLGR